MVPFTKQIIVTSALPYANGPIHIGHLVEYIQTDTFVRFLKLTGKEVVYCCADDTHGTPVEIKARQLGLTPEKLISIFHKEHQEDFSKFLIRFDSYYSTNSKENKEFSDLIFNRLNKKGHIYKKIVKITFCTNCKRNLPDRYVKGECPKCHAKEQHGDSCEACGATYKTVDLIGPYCTICGNKNTITQKESEHYFFKLSAFSDFLKKWLNQNKRLQPEIRNYILDWIKKGLEDWDITRDGPYFGFNIPGEKDKYYYVWLDAPIGYISSLANYLGNDVKKAEKIWNDSEIIHFIGKDIIYFHFLFWPAVLKGSDFKLPDYIVVHGFLTVKGEKMSKSRGTFLTASEFAQQYNPEHLRFYYAKVLSRKMADVNLDFRDFQDSINNELVSNLGNFCYRTLYFLEKNFNGEIKKLRKDERLISEINEGIKKVENSYADVNFNEAVKNIMHISSLGNKYFQEQKPWETIKEDREKTQEVVGLCANIAKNLSILAAPILPAFSEELQKQLNVRNLSWKDLNFKLENHKIGKPKILVSKVEEIKEIKKEEKIGKVEYEIDDKVKKLGLKFHLAQISNVKIRKKSEALERLKKEVENKVKNTDLKHNKIYLEAKRLYKNKEFEPPFAYLINLIKEKGKLPTINAAVDSYNLVAVKHLISVGAHDISRIKGKIRFKITDDSEKYIPLGSMNPEKVEAGEYACMDDNEILCRLDIKQCETTKVDDKTKNILVYVQGNKENNDEELKSSLKEICENITRYCSGTYKAVGEGQETFPLNIKVAKIISVEDHPNADKLFVLKIDLGSEKRQLVAGMKEHYSKDELKGKKIAVITNLKHAKFRGVESQGMLLAGEDDKNVGLLAPEKSKPGDAVTWNSLQNSNEELTIDDFLKLNIIVKGRKATIEGIPLRTEKEEINVEKVKDGAKIH